MMRFGAQRLSRRPGASGQSMVEYLVIAGIAAALLAVPIDGNASVVEMMLAAIKAGYAKFLAAISLPQ